MDSRLIYGTITMIGGKLILNTPLFTNQAIDITTNQWGFSWDYLLPTVDMVKVRLLKENEVYTIYGAPNTSAVLWPNPYDYSVTYTDPSWNIARGRVPQPGEK